MTMAKGIGDVYGKGAKDSLSLCSASALTTTAVQQPVHSHASECHACPLVGDLHGHSAVVVVRAVHDVRAVRGDEVAGPHAHLEVHLPAAQPEKGVLWQRRNPARWRMNELGAWAFEIRLQHGRLRAGMQGPSRGTFPNLLQKNYAHYQAHLWEKMMGI